MCGWGWWTGSCRRWASRDWRLPLHARSRGLVFQTGSPSRAGIRGAKDPGYCRTVLRAGLHRYAISCELCVPTEGGYGGDSGGFAAMALQGER